MKQHLFLKGNHGAAAGSPAAGTSSRRLSGRQPGARREAQPERVGMRVREPDASRARPQTNTRPARKDRLPGAECFRDAAETCQNMAGMRASITEGTQRDTPSRYVNATYDHRHHLPTPFKFYQSQARACPTLGGRDFQVQTNELDEESRVLALGKGSP